jgi:hypothetical protein
MQDTQKKCENGSFPPLKINEVMRRYPQNGVFVPNIYPSFMPNKIFLGINWFFSKFVLLIVGEK